MDKSKVYYQTTCGCTWTKEQLGKGDNTQNYRLVCPYHKEFIEIKFGFCITCGDKISYTNPKLAVAKKCQTCNPSLKRKKRHRSRKSDQKVKKLAHEVVMPSLIERADCATRPLCMEMFLDEDYLPCHGCDDYEPGDPFKDLQYNVDLSEIDSFIRAENPTTRAEGHLKWGKFYEKRQKILIKSLQNNQ